MSVNVAVQGARGHLVAPGTVVESAGVGPALELGSLASRPVLIILRVEDIIEQEGLHVSIWGSADGTNWGNRALFWFPEAFYCGATPASLDLRERPDIKLLQARWELNRWGRGYPIPHFKFAVEIQELAPR